MNKVMKKTMLAVVGLVLTVSCISSGLAGTFDETLSNSTIKWVGHPDNLLPVRFISNENGAGYQFFCDYSQVNPRYPRCFWDATFPPIDLSKMATIVMKVEIKNAASIQRIAFYFNNGKTWYLSRSASGLSEGMNNVVFQLADYKADIPASGKRIKFNQTTDLKHVVRVRFNIFNSGTTPSVVTLYNIHASTTKVKAGVKKLFTPPATPKLSKRSEKFDKSGRLLESRLLFDEKCAFLLRGEKLLSDTATAGFNVIMPVVWFGRDGALFHSEYTQIEPRFSKYFTNGRDGLAEFIKQAHAKKIEVHPCFRITYCKRSKMLFPQFATTGVPDYAYDLQNPAYRDLIVREIVAFVKKYDVDGINFDYVRTMGISFTKVAAKLYRAKYHKEISELKKQMSPAVRKRFLEWQRDAVSDIVRRISEGVRAAKPQVVISVYGHPLKKPLLSEQGRNSWLWVEKGWVDVVYSMCYSWVPNFNAFAATRQASAKPDHFAMILSDYDHKDGKVVPRKIEQVVRLIDYYLRRFPERGVALYSYGWLTPELIQALKKGPFKQNSVAYWGKEKSGRFVD